MGQAGKAWDNVGCTEDHIGTVSPEHFTVADQTGADVLEFIADLELADVTVNGSPVTSG